MKYFLSMLTLKTAFYFFKSVVYGLVIAFFTSYSNLPMTEYIISSDKKTCKLLQSELCQMFWVETIIHNKSLIFLFLFIIYLKFDYA